MKRTLFPLLAATLLTMACGSNENNRDKKQTVNDEGQVLPGDTSIYGLACEGCTDSLLILLPLNGGDPDTFNIFNAQLNHRIFGRPDIGDMMAVICDSQAAHTAARVINLDKLQGEWRYQVTPRLRRRQVDSAMAQQPVNLPDSFVRRWLQPKEYGYDIRRDYVVHPVGGVSPTEAQQGPVEYPTLKRYREWHVLNGRFILSETRRDTTRQSVTVSIDTVDIVRLRRDTLTLRFADHEQSFYRKKEAGSPQ